MKPIEARLRDALDERAAQVTEDALARHHADPTLGVASHSHRDSHRRTTFALVAAAVAFILAGVSWIELGNRQGVPANPLPTVTSALPSAAQSPDASTSGESSTSQSATPSEQPVPDTSHIAGTYTRAEVPWAVVGRGWVAAVRKDSQSSPTMTLLLMSPWGAEYTIGSVPDTTTGLMAVSRDGRRVFLNGWVVDMVSGAVTPFNPPNLIAVTFIGADSESYLVQTGIGTTRKLLWFSGANTVPSKTMATDMQDIHPSQDGRYVAGWTLAGSIVILDTATGDTAARIQRPAGRTSCMPHMWWPDDKLMVTCEGAASIPEVWQYSVASRTLTHVARSPAYLYALPTSVGILVSHEITCNGRPLGVLAPSGDSDTPLAQQPAGTGGGHLVGNVDDIIYLVYENGCPNATSPYREDLVAYDLRAHTTVTLTKGAVIYTIIW